MAIYYVDSSRPDNTGNGTSPETAKKTIAAALALISADGDILRFVANSIWYEGFNLAAKNYITYEAYGSGDNPIIQGTTALVAGNWSGPDGNGCYTQVLSSGYSDMWLIEEDHALKKGSSAALPEGAGTWWFFYVGDPTYQMTVYYKPTGGGDPKTNGLNTAWVTGANTQSGACSNIVLDGLHYKFRGHVFYDPSNNHSPITIQNCLFTELYDGFLLDNMGLIYSNVIVQDNIFTACRKNAYLIAEGSGYFVSAIIRRNTISKSNQLNDGITGWDTDAGDYDGLSIQTIRNSLIEGNDISGKCVNSAGYSAAITCWVPGTLNTTGNIIRNNYIHDIEGSGIIWAGADVPNTDCQIYNNIVTGFGVNGIEINKSQTSTTKSGVYFNTVYNGPNGIYLGAQADYYILKNNIVNNCTYAIRFEGGINANTQLDNNAYYHPTSLQFRRSSTDMNLTDYKTYVSPADQNPVTSDPSFTNAGGSYALDTDFQLSGGSPCIGTGATGTGITTDYGDRTRKATPDIGAWEYLAAYSRGSYADLPLTDADLTNSYTATDIDNVATDNEVYASQTGITGYIIHEYKNNVGAYTSVKLSWDGKSTTAPSSSIVKLQIYNRTTTTWVDVATNNVANANEDFTLSNTVDISANYKDADNIIACRVWQQIV